MCGSSLLGTVLSCGVLGLGGDGGGEGGAGEVGFLGGGEAEEAFELAGELGGGFVADFEGSLGCAEAVLEHEGAGFMEADGLEVLEGRGIGDGAEVFVEGGGGHGGCAGEVFDGEGAVVGGVDEVESFADLGEAGVAGSEGTECTVLFGEEDAIEDFADDGGAKDAGVGGVQK